MASLEKYCYKSEKHAKTLLDNFKDQFMTLQFCDVRLLVSGQIFHAHRNVLAAASPYFHAMFAGGLAECLKEDIRIQCVSEKIFFLLLRFVYSGTVEVTEDNCQDLLAAADMFGMSEVLDVCCTFLRRQLDVSNCIGIYLFAEAHGCQTLMKDSEAFITGHFQAVVKADEYQALPRNVLVKFLHSESLYVENEIQVFCAALQWIMHDAPARRRHVFEVLAPVRIPVISPKQLERHIEDCPDLSLRIALRKLAQDFWHFDRRLPHDIKLSRVKPYMFQPRQCAQKNVFVIGGYTRDRGGRWSDSQSLDSVECFDSFHQHWKSLPKLRHTRSGHGVTVLSGLIYVVGGESDSLILDNAECYDPSTSKWTMLPCMTVPRCGLGVCVLENNIYALGGWVGSEIGDTIERYNPEINMWTYVDKVRTLRFSTGVVQYEGLIYVIGGLSDLGTELRTMESYNPVNREWTSLASMSIPRAHMGVAAFDNAIYVVGGWNEDSGALNTVEKYCTEKEQWTFVAPMSQARAGAAVAIVNSLVYVIGGRTSSPEFAAPHTLDSVECYDPQTDSWLEVCPMLTSRCEAGVAVL